ncbi:MAG: response regulator [Bacteroidales bacterium]|nr:response regulator [Bacteroidales bacterium]MCM1414892.1 response regulator [bacterium]MCM1423933.1 response regulator [bacterium]
MTTPNDMPDLYKEIVNNALEGIMVLGMNGKIALLNPSAKQMLGLSDEDIGNTFINVFLTREGTDDFNEAILASIYEKEKVSNMPVNYTLEGKIRNLTLTTSYIMRDGERSVVVVMDDVTELNELRDARTALDKIRKLNREYEKAKDEAERANEAKSLFLSNMSHEIRTPINAVLGMNEMILRECADEQILSYAENIRSSGKTLLFLINDILDMSKIESGKMEIIPVEYEPANLLMDLWNVIFLRAQEKDLSVRFSLDETLPRVLFGDDVRIKQIVTNLLTNAVKYTPQGGLTLHAAYERKGEDGIVLTISVQDTGMGIKQEDMGKLFESFQRLDEEKNRNIEGTGLGMNITMSLLSLMDGDMKVESEYGKGSTFTVTIPQRIVCDEPTGDFESIRSGQEQKKKARGQNFEAPGARVLVVDDNAMNLTVFTSLLKRTRMQITTASSGKECLALVKENPYHIIFMDHMMPEMDGIETLHEIQNMADHPNKETPVIVLTANAVAGAREAYLKEGFVDFLTKPIDGDILEQAVETYLPKDLVSHTAVSEKTSEKPGILAESGQMAAYGISLENGLSHAQEDEETYLGLVRLFLKEKEKQSLMQGYIDAGNMKDYAILVHGLKGNARTLGADALADTAFTHEKESKAGNASYVAAHFDELLALWEKAQEGFTALWNARGADQEEAAAAEGQECLALTQDDLEKAAALLDDFETKEAIGQLKEWLANPLVPKMREKLQSALEALEDEFDEEKAITLLRN